MRVEGIGQGAGQGNVAAKAQALARGAQGKRTHGATDNAEPTQGAPAATGGEKVKGVVRLLQEGHFKGVADVRLRINFYDELAAIETANMGGAVEEKLPTILNAINSELDALVASTELDGEQAAAISEAQSVFNAAIQQAGDDFEGGAAAMSQLLDDVQQAFDSLAESLSPILAALASVEDGLLAPPVNAVSETFVADLREAFNTQLEGIEGALSAANPLPPLSEPSGNGGAYDKFLAIYNQLRGLSREEVAPTPLLESGPVDTAV